MNTRSPTRASPGEGVASYLGMRVITLEEHFVTSGFLKAVEPHMGQGGGPLAHMHDALLDLDAGRIAAMDAAGIDVQVLSLASVGWEALPAAEQTALARDINDELHAAVRAHPSRFAGWATVGLAQPDAAAKELERCVGELGFRGALVDGTTGGSFLDDPRFLPFWEAAAALRVPVYVHPAPPPEPVMKAYYTGLPGELGRMLSIAGWGWHAETGLHLLRLIVSGLFVRFPELDVIVGHMGEGVPYALARSSGILSRAANLPMTVADYMKRNVWITTSGYFTPEPLRCAQDVVGADRILFSIDYPFSPTQKGREFLDRVAAGMSEEEQTMFAGGRASRLLAV